MIGIAAAFEHNAVVRWKGDGNDGQICLKVAVIG